MFILINDTKIYYHMIGEGKPIFMLHGFGCDHRLMEGCMEPVFQDFGNYKRIYIDLPGMGKSDAALSQSSADKILELLINFINEFAEGHFLLAGESYGGYLVRGILVRLFERVDGFLLICPVVIPEHAKRNTPAKNMEMIDKQFFMQLSREEKENFCESAVVADQYTYRRYQAEIEPGIKASNKQFLKNLTDNYEFSFDADKELHQLKFGKPVLFITGRQDARVGYQDLWGVIEDYKRASFAVLDTAGHNLQIEQPDLFSCLVKEWIKRVEKYII